MNFRPRHRTRCRQKNAHTREPARESQAFRWNRTYAARALAALPVKSTAKRPANGVFSAPTAAWRRSATSRPRCARAGSRCARQGATGVRRRCSLMPGCDAIRTAGDHLSSPRCTPPHLEGRRVASSAIPAVGDRFGMLSFVELSGERYRGQQVWVMTCDCGNTRSFLSSNVKRGNTTSCCGNGKRQDLTGRRFGMLVALEKRPDPNGRVRWFCRCDCGGETVSYTASLNSGHTQSCGCLQRESALSRFIDISGERFGTLTVVVRADDQPGNGARWLCRCDCGEQKVILGSKLRQGVVISCGCATGSRERIRPDRIVDKYNAHAHTRRSLQRRAGGTFTPVQVSELLVKQRHRCAWCGEKLSRFHRDHRKALANGGSNDIRNIELLCGPCNLKKGAKDEIVWARENGRLL